MMSNSCAQPNENSEHNVFRNLSARDGEGALFARFLAAHDFAPATVEALTHDLRKFSKWFSLLNNEPFAVARVTMADVADFRRHLRQDCSQAVTTINRALVSIRRYLGWLTTQNKLEANPAALVKELKRQQLAPKGLERSVVRKLLREVELRGDLRAGAIFSLLLHTGARVGDIALLDIDDVTLGERSGAVVFRHGKGSKQRVAPLALNARKALQAYLEVRPPVASSRLFIGERGALTVRGIQALCDKYSAFIGVKIYPHLLRHTFAHQFLRDGGNLVQLAQILGHSNINTTAIYTKDSVEQLAEAAEQVSY